jgi:hypothetical protein
VDLDQQPVVATPATPVTAPAVPIATPAVAPPRRPSSPRILNLALVGALVLAVAGIGFAAGRLTAAPATALTGTSGPFVNGVGPRNGANGQPGGGLQVGPIGLTGGPSIEGTVESITDTTLTIKTADGQTMQIALDDSTTYHAQTDASADDVATGGKVLVRLNMQRGDGAASGMSAGDVTVVP